MKKVININFQGNIIPIEETAYDILQKYSESLRRHFAYEEGRDEIINDIETRISELFTETLKKGATCITDADVNAVIASMGRPEDFDMDDDATEPSTSSSNTNTGNTSSNTQQSSTFFNTGAKRLYRDENHKILGGVCSGLANYFGIDPVIMRIIAIVFFSIAFIPYFVIWIAVPSSAEKVIGSPRKRLFRDPDSKMLAGVCSGLSQYFGVNIWIPRALFLIPFLSIAFRFNHWYGWDFPHFLSLSFSPVAVTTYIILWILVPEAKTTSDKLEMKGKPVDLNSIKDTVQNDLNEFKDKAQNWSKNVNTESKKWSSETQEKAKAWGDDFGEKSKQWSDNISQAAKDMNDGYESEDNTQQGFADTTYGNTPRNNKPSGLSTFAKILSYIIIGLVAITVVGILFSAGIAFLAVSPGKDFVIKDGWENILTWSSFFLFIWVPIIGIIIWFIRLVTKKKGGRSIFRGSFIGLWILGWISLFGLASLLGHDFSHTAHTDPVEFKVNDKNLKTLVIASSTSDDENYNDWDEEDFNDFMRYFGNDSIRIENINLKMIQSPDNNYHVETVSYAYGSNKKEATDRARHIPFQLRQTDSVLFIPPYFYINKEDKFRNQRVIVKISIPLGKQIIIKESKWRNNFRISLGHRDNGINSWDNDFDWKEGVLYVMTSEGLKPVYEKDSDKNSNEKTTPTDKKDKQENKNSNKPKAETKTSDEDDNSDGNENAVTYSHSNGIFNMASLLIDKFGI